MTPDHLRALLEELYGPAGQARYAASRAHTAYIDALASSVRSINAAMPSIRKLLAGISAAMTRKTAPLPLSPLTLRLLAELYPPVTP